MTQKEMLRREALRKFQKKRQFRSFEKKILYSSRKQLAEKRPRHQVRQPSLSENEIIEASAYFLYLGWSAVQMLPTPFLIDWLLPLSVSVSLATSQNAKQAVRSFPLSVCMQHVQG
jgi:hypothetical protein